MARNKLTDLNDHLFLALERLNDDELPAEKIKSESERAKAIVALSKEIINNAKTTIEAIKLITSDEVSKLDLPDSLGFKKLSSNN